MKKLDILIPYRDRTEHLNHFLNDYVPRLKKFCEIEVYIIEQTKKHDFNRGKLLNIGILHSKNTELILHDVDVLPNDYIIEKVISLNDDDITRIYNSHDQSLGGITKFTRKSVEMINGFPNNIFGWGIEDRILYYRSKIYGIQMSDNFKDKVNFQMLKHVSNARNYTGETKKMSDYENYVYSSLKKEEQITYIQKNGLNNCEYTLLNTECVDNVTKLLVEL